MKQVFDRAALAYRINSTFFKVAESLIAVVTGAFIGVAIEKDSVSVTVVVLSVFFVATQVLKFVLDKTVGESVLNELWSTHELQELKAASQRTHSNFNRIRRSIVSLNERTCSIEQLCAQSFEDYITPMLDACFDNPNELFCTSDAKIYVEIYSNWIRDIANNELVTKSVTFVYRADFVEASSDADFLREIESVQKRASETNKFSNYHAQYSRVADRIIACPIPTVCEDGGTLGAIVIAANLGDSSCCNLEEVLTIFSRVVANSISKYNECVQTRYQKGGAISEAQQACTANAVLAAVPSASPS